MRKPIASQTKVFRCAIYTRKSSEEGLEQDFNSLHAQRESCDAYIKSQRHEGWTPLPALYDDGGYSGGSTERPAQAPMVRPSVVKVPVGSDEATVKAGALEDAKVKARVDGKTVVKANYASYWWNPGTTSIDSAVGPRAPEAAGYPGSATLRRLSEPVGAACLEFVALH